MKKKLTSIITIALIVCLTAGCGNNAQESGAEASPTPQAEETAESGESAESQPDNEEESVSPTEAEIVDSGKEAENEFEPEPLSWLEEHGISITPQGEFTFRTMSYDKKTKQDLEEFDVPATVSITETTEGTEEGYKKVIAVFTCDMSACKNNYLKNQSAFDRYTGTSFEIDSSVTYGNGTKNGNIPLEYDGKTYDVSIKFDYDLNSPTDISTVTVTCPVDYDGTVFSIGCASQELVAQDAEIDYAERLHTIDELPFYGSNGYTYYYFSYSNE